MQFYDESILVALFSFILSLAIVEIVPPWFNQIADKETTILWTNPLFWLMGLLFGPPTFSMSMDLAPTILEATGIKKTENYFDGESILPYLLSPSKQEIKARVLYFTRCEGGEQFGGEVFMLQKKQKETGTELALRDFGTV